ncbi:alpha/beta hydrolase family protein [Pseudohongiella sp.]|uniref:PET hydrolase/cutinase-like domain-containing protein n=1 Tax=marine sediment metagenome TaxID=412755 RepID=A0A0F9VVA2_9ZZZZ|nr:alpha/beta hydrolase [Pseudohongiella sp.]HDZ07998.1 alpha/beta hydrolase [Pseudohongiella sp.]HEA64159.1 alpha/beta hydrolase [Pseudohongiella sp.]
MSKSRCERIAQHVFLLVLSVLLLSACTATPGPRLDNQSLHQSYFDIGSRAGVDITRGGPHCRIFHPINMDYGRHPIIIWGNGTGTSPASYRDLLEHWASHGFVVVAAMSPNPGTGREMSRCLDFALNLNSEPGPFQGRLDPAHIGVAGHSQGGAGAIMLGRDLRITTVVALQPYIQGVRFNPTAVRGQSGPMLLLSGADDVTAPPDTHQQPVYYNTDVPVTWLTLRGATHLAPMFTGGSYRGAMTAWFRMHLRGDEEAARMFEGEDCVICGDERWTIRAK